MIIVTHCRLTFFFIYVNVLLRILSYFLCSNLQFNIWFKWFMVKPQTCDIWMTYEYIRVTYGWHTSTYEWHTSTYEWHTNDIRVHTSGICVAYEYIRVTYEYTRMIYDRHAKQNYAYHLKLFDCSFQYHLGKNIALRSCEWFWLLGCSILCIFHWNIPKIDNNFAK